jgi:predicted transcriptional regulator
MTPADIRRIRKRLGITQEQFAERLGVHAVTVRKCEAGCELLMVSGFDAIPAVPVATLRALI